MSYGFDEADAEIHAAEVEADAAAWHADQMAELDAEIAAELKAEREAEAEWMARREAEVACGVAL